MARLPGSQLNLQCLAQSMVDNNNIFTEWMDPSMHAYLLPSLGFAFSWAGFIRGLRSPASRAAATTSLETPAVSERSPGLTLIGPAWSRASPCTNRCGQGGMCVSHWLGLTDPPATWTKDSSFTPAIVGASCARFLLHPLPPRLSAAAITEHHRLGDLNNS